MHPRDTLIPPSRWDVNVDAPPPVDELSSGDWLAITDTRGEAGDLFIRLGAAADGRPIVTGMYLSGEREITAKTLRAIQLATILRTITWRESGSAPPASIGGIGPTGLARFEGVVDAIDAVVDSAERIEGASTSGSRAPRRDDLERFASTYRGFLRESPYDAVARTASHLKMHRATAHRWIARCRDLGLLDPREETR
jgi:hypothetical protein